MPVILVPGHIGFVEGLSPENKKKFVERFIRHIYDDSQFKSEGLGFNLIPYIDLLQIASRFDRDASLEVLRDIIFHQGGLQFSSQEAIFERILQVFKDYPDNEIVVKTFERLLGGFSDTNGVPLSYGSWWDKGRMQTKIQNILIEMGTKKGTEILAARAAQQEKTREEAVERKKARESQKKLEAQEKKREARRVVVDKIRNL